MANPNTILSEGLEIDGNYYVVFEAEIEPVSFYGQQRETIIQGKESANPGINVYTRNVLGADIGPRKKPH